MKPKIHKNVTIVEINDLGILKDLNENTSFQYFILKKLSKTHVLLDNNRLDEFLQILEEKKIVPRIIESDIP